MTIRQSFCFPCFAPTPDTWDTCFRQARAIGFEAMELWFRDEHFESLMASAQAAGLKVASMCGHQSLTVGMNQVSEHARIEAELRESMRVAERWGIPNLICFSGNHNEGQSEEDAIAACVACLRRVAPEAEARGLCLNMELLNSKVDHPGYQCDHTRFGVAVCQQVASPSVKLLYDIYHMQIMEGDVIRTIREHIQWIGHFHTAGNPGRNDLDTAQELNYPAIIQAIAATGYDRYLAHEFWPKADAVAALKHAFECCRVG